MILRINEVKIFSEVYKIEETGRGDRITGLPIVHISTEHLRP